MREKEKNEWNAWTNNENWVFTKILNKKVWFKVQTNQDAIVSKQAFSD